MSEERSVREMVRVGGGAAERERWRNKWKEKERGDEKGTYGERQKRG